MFRPLGPALVVWTKPANLGGDEDDECAPDSARLALERAVVTAGGRFHPTSDLAFECTSAREDDAEAIDDEIEDFLAIQRVGGIAAPWAAQGEPTVAQSLARRTYRVAMRAEDGARGVGAGPSWWTLLLGDRKAMGDYEAQTREGQRKAVEAALSAERAVRPVDEEVARLVASSLSAPSYDDREEAKEQLRERFGTVVPDDASKGRFFAVASRAGARVRIELGYAAPQTIDADVTPMLSWLCAKGCTDLRLVARVAKPEGGGR